MPKWPWPPPPNSLGMEHKLVYTSLRSLRTVLAVGLLLGSNGVNGSCGSENFMVFLWWCLATVSMARRQVLSVVS
jgi:hypothetical protein